MSPVVSGCVVGVALACAGCCVAGTVFWCEGCGAVAVDGVACLPGVAWSCWLAASSAPGGWVVVGCCDYCGGSGAVVALVVGAGLVAGVLFGGFAGGAACSLGGFAAVDAGSWGHGYAPGVRFVGAALVVVLLVGCGGDSDAGAVNACRVFREIAADARAGVLTDGEMRERSREVYEKAQASTSPEFRDAAAALARDVLVPGSGVIGAFGDECDERDL